MLPQHIFHKKEDKYYIDFLKTNNKESFKKLYALVSPWLLKVIFRITGDMEAARDIEQDTWMTVINTKTSYKIIKGKFNNLIFTIAKNKALMWHRKQLVALNYLRVDREHLQIFEDPFEKINQLEIQENINKAIDHLPEIFQEVIILHCLAEMKISDISIVLDMSENTIKSRLKRAKERLEFILNPFYEQEFIK